MSNENTSAKTVTPTVTPPTAPKHTFDAWYLMACELHEEYDPPNGDLTLDEFLEVLKQTLK